MLAREGLARLFYSSGEAASIKRDVRNSWPRDSHEERASPKQESMLAGYPFLSGAKLSHLLYIVRIFFKTVIC